MRSGPTSSLRPSAISAIASSASRNSRFPRDKNDVPVSVSDDLRVVRWIRRAPTCFSSSASRSLTIDLARPRRRAAAEMDPSSATATNVATPSNLIIVRPSRTPESTLADYIRQSARRMILSRVFDQVRAGEIRMDRISIALTAAVLLTGPALGQAPSFPPNFQTQDVTTNGTTLHVRIGGKGPAVVLLHGYGETGDMWGPMADDLARDHTVVAPDLRGMGLSAKPPSGYEKK